jgi:hypothetical protein
MCVPPQFQDEICPEPDKEIVQRMKNEILEREVEAVGSKEEDRAATNRSHGE